MRRAVVRRKRRVPMRESKVDLVVWRDCARVEC